MTIQRGSCREWHPLASEWQKVTPKAIIGRRMIGGNAFRDQRIIGGSGIGCSLINQPPKVFPWICNLIIDVDCVHEVRTQVYSATTQKRRPAGYQPAAVSPGNREGWVSFRAHLTIDPISPLRLLRICGTSLVLLLSQWQMIAHPVDVFTLPTAPPTSSKARQLPPATWLNHWSQAAVSARDTQPATRGTLPTPETLTPLTSWVYSTIKLAS